ncbi:MAG TPA: hypothetical protein VF607_17105, partial [Verrucomicrobiae bacterium]
MLKNLLHRPKWLTVMVGLMFFWLARSEWLTGSHLWQKTEGLVVDRLYLLRSELPPNDEIKLIGLGS